MYVSLRVDGQTRQDSRDFRGRGQASPGSDVCESTRVPDPGSKPPLLSVALLTTKDEANDVIKRLLAQVNSAHATCPSEIIFRSHSDKGGEFVNDELQT